MTSLQFTKSPTGISCRYSARSQAVTGYGCDINPASVYPGPHSVAVSGGIPSKPSSDVLRAQKNVGFLGLHVGRGRIVRCRKSLQAANTNSNNRVLPCTVDRATGANLLPAPVALFSPWTVTRGVWS